MDHVDNPRNRVAALAGLGGAAHRVWARWVGGRVAGRRRVAAVACAVALAVVASVGVPSPVAAADGGGAFGWGRNNHGQVGDGTLIDRNTPRPIILPDGTSLQAAKVDGGFRHSIALGPDKKTVYAWGANDKGQLGDGTTTERPQPVKVHLSLPEKVSILDISAGHAHNLALDSTGQVWAWGSNNRGQIGDGGWPTNRTTPVPVHQPHGVTMQGIAAGGAFSLAYTTVPDSFPLEAIYAWGSNNHGQLGDGTTIDRHRPVTADLTNLSTTGGLDAVVISAGDAHSLLTGVGATWKNQYLVAWGWNYYGQLGVGDTTDRHRPVIALKSYRPDGPWPTPTVSAGGRHSAMMDPGPYTWGLNNMGQLGDGTTINRTSPVALTTIDAGIVDIVAGGYHTLALTQDPSQPVYAWGENVYGQLGDGTNITRLTPVATKPRLQGSFSVGAGYEHSLYGSQ